jgi:hemolysin activation/secretion protein
MWLEMEVGVGRQAGQGYDPKVMLQISKDNGKTWSNELWRSFGRVGKYLTRARWVQLGRARNWTFKFRVTDPVRTVFVAAWGRVSR